MLLLGAVLAGVHLSATAAVAQQQTTAHDAVQLFRQGERDSQERTGEAGSGRVVAYEHDHQLGGRSDPAPPTARPAVPSRQPGLPAGVVGVLVAAVATAATAVAVITRRGGRRTGAHHAA